MDTVLGLMDGRHPDLLRRDLTDVAEGRTTLPAALDDYETRMLAYGAEAVEHSLDALGRFLPARPTAS